MWDLNNFFSLIPILAKMDHHINHMIPIHLSTPFAFNSEIKSNLVYLLITSTNEGQALSYWETMLDESIPRKMEPMEPIVRAALGSDKTLSIKFMNDIFEVWNKFVYYIISLTF